MAFKRALVVDDSRSARVALKKLLDENQLDVEFAESGEEALAFLDREMVDVVFMDHHMPGMDGLEAVSHIKRNPRTATIPVMMYTTREGEVYVSQARALGAVGVLPKQVQPGVLFDMLLELGLVQDRRAPAREMLAEAEEADEIDRRLEDQVKGISLQAIVSRILEDQHLSLRADILRGNREFARQVATEILEESRSAESTDGPAPVADGGYPQRVVVTLILFLLVPILVLGGLYFRAADERDAARSQIANLDQDMEERLQVAESVTSGLLLDMNQERRAVLEKHLAGLSWSLNEGGGHAFEVPAFNDERLQQLETLLTHLEEIGFQGTVRLSAHLGEFCLSTDRLGTLTPAESTVAVETCATIGHPLDSSNFVDDRQSERFAAYMADRADRRSRIQVELVAHDRFGSRPRYPFPEGSVTAGEWNAVAVRNNRVEYELIPATR
jgi:CheY-like chemotaxis protein